MAAGGTLENPHTPNSKKKLKFPPQSILQDLKMAGGHSKIKITPPPKLDSKDLTLDKLQTWNSSMRNCFKHDPDHKQFLKGQEYQTWTALKTDKDRGINVVPVVDVDATRNAAKIAIAKEESAKIREHLEDFLHKLSQWKGCSTESAHDVFLYT